MPLRSRLFPALNKAIKRRVLLFVVLLFAQIAATAGEFSRTLTPEHLRATGLGKLTSKELAAFDTLIERYTTGLPHDAPVAPTPAPTVGPPVKPEARPDKRIPDWVGALITLKRAENTKVKAEALESRIAGDFDGWTGRSNFKLENGQVWTQVNKDESYVWVPAIKSPKVKIFPASFGTFWLEIEGVTQRCRIRPIRLE